MSEPKTSAVTFVVDAEREFFRLAQNKRRVSNLMCGQHGDFGHGERGLADIDCYVADGWEEDLGIDDEFWVHSSGIFEECASQEALRDSESLSNARQVPHRFNYGLAGGNLDAKINVAIEPSIFFTGRLLKATVPSMPKLPVRATSSDSPILK